MPTRKILLSLLLPICSYININAGGTVSTAYNTTRKAASKLIWGTPPEEMMLALIDQDLSETINFLTSKPSEKDVAAIKKNLIEHFNIEMLNVLHNTVMFSCDPITNCARSHIEAIGVDKKMKHAIVQEKRKRPVLCDLNKLIMFEEQTNVRLPLSSDGHVESIVFNPRNCNQFLTANSFSQKNQNYDFVMFWELNNFEIARSISFYHCHTDYITQIIFSNDGQLGFSGSADRKVYAYNFATEENLCLIEDLGTEIVALAVTADDKHLVIGGKDNIIRIFEIENQSIKSIWDLNNIGVNKECTINSLILNHDNCAYVGLSNGLSFAWNIFAPEDFLITLSHKCGAMDTTATFSNDGQYVAAATTRDDLKTIQYWDVTSYEPQLDENGADISKKRSLILMSQCKNAPLNNQFKHINFSKNDSIIRAIDSDGNLVMWDLTSELKELTLEQLIFLVHAYNTPHNVLMKMHEDDPNYLAVYGTFNQYYKGTIDQFVQGMHETNLLISNSQAARYDGSFEGLDRSTIA